MELGERLRSLRRKRGWKLRDMARALGVTEATISRVERGLQQPSQEMISAWETLLTGKRWTPVLQTKVRRRPRGVITHLADLYLADVKAGLSSENAGWRDLGEVGLDPNDLNGMGSDIEFDKDHGRVRISKNANLDQVEQAKNINNYRTVVDIEQKTLLPVVENELPVLWNAVRNERTKGCVLLTGLSSMLRFTADFLDSYRSLMPDKDPACLGSGSIGAASLILETLGINFVIPTAPVLRQAGLEVLIEPNEQGPYVDAAKDLAVTLEMPGIATKLGSEVVTAIGAAWATARFLELKNASILTEEGQQRLAERFWQGIGFSRKNIASVWSESLESPDLSELKQISSLLWSWPEVI